MGDPCSEVASRTHQEEENLCKLWVKAAGLEVNSCMVTEVKHEWKEVRGQGAVATLGWELQWSEVHGHRGAGEKVFGSTGLGCGWTRRVGSLPNPSLNTKGFGGYSGVVDCEEVVWSLGGGLHGCSMGLLIYIDVWNRRAWGCWFHVAFALHSNVHVYNLSHVVHAVIFFWCYLKSNISLLRTDQCLWAHGDGERDFCRVSEGVCGHCICCCIKWAKRRLKESY